MRTKMLRGRWGVTTACVVSVAAVLVLCIIGNIGPGVSAVNTSQEELSLEECNTESNVSKQHDREIKLLASSLRKEAVSEYRSIDAKGLIAIEDADVPLASSINIEETVSSTRGVKEIADSDVPLADNVEFDAVPCKWIFALAGIVIAVILVFGMLWIIE